MIYRVLYREPGSDVSRSTDVQIIDDYTTFEDIPKIIGVSLSGNPLYGRQLLIKSAVLIEV